MDMVTITRINQALLQILFQIQTCHGKKNKNLNIGFDARFFDRLNITFDYYTRRTSDLLQDVPTSMAVGFQTMLKKCW